MLADLLAPGFASNYADRKLSWIYFSGTLDAAIWGCELAKGEGRERIYVVEPTGAFEDDPNLTDKRFPGNPTQDSGDSILIRQSAWPPPPAPASPPAASIPPAWCGPRPPRDTRSPPSSVLPS